MVFFQNISHLSILVQWLSAIGFILGLSIVSFLLSFWIIQKKYNGNPLLSLSIRISTGLAIIIIILSFFLVIGLYYLHIVSSVLIIGALITFFFSKIFIFEELKSYKNLWVFLLFIPFSINSLLPVYRFDEMSYHLPYVMKWIHNGGIMIDTNMRYPLYTFNWHAILGFAMMLGGYVYAHILSFLAALLATILITGFLIEVKTNKWLSYIGGIAFFFTPLVQRYMNVAYIDIPAMFLLTCAVIGMYQFLKNQTIFNAILSGLFVATLIGIKPTFALLSPLFIIIPILYKIEWRNLIYFIIVLLVFGGIWYVRNILITGDPLSPAMNIIFRGSDPFWDKIDYELLKKDIEIPLSGITEWLRLPFTMISTGAYAILRDYPIMGYVIIWPFTLVLLLSKKLEKNIKAFIIFTIGAVLLWVATSILIRYVHFLPLIIISSFIGINYLIISIKNKILKNLVFVISILICFFSVPTCYGFAKHSLLTLIPKNKTEQYSFAGYGKGDLFILIDSISTKYPNATIYAYNLNQYKYYFQKADLHVVGDNLGKNKFELFEKVFKSGEEKEFLKKAHVNLLIIDTLNSKLRINNCQFKIVGNEKNYICFSIP